MLHTIWGDAMLPYLVAGALIVGPYSGIDINTLLDKPMLVRDTILELTAADVAQQATGAGLQEVDGTQVSVTKAGFELNLEADFPAGRCIFEVEVSAPDSGTDSFWLAVDGKQLDQPLVLSVNAFTKRSMTFDVTAAGRKALRLSLREGPGAAIKKVSVAAATTNMPRSPLREELQGTHPHIFFTASDVEAMRARLQDERVRQFYSVPGVLTRKPPPFTPGTRNGGAFRSLGTYALGYLLKPEDAQLAAIIEWLEMATTYGPVGVDLDAEYFMEGLALTYDWLYDYLPEDLRNRVRETIARQCRLVFNASLAGLTGGTQDFQQNHYWFAHLSLALGAAAICGEEPEAERWLAWAWDRYERIALTLSPEGSFHEGPGYWDYSMPTLYLYTDLYEWCTGLEIPIGNDGLSGQAQFRFHYIYPGFERSAAMEDSSVKLGRPPVKLTLWEAKRFYDPVPMGIAALLNRGPSSDCFNLLWLDENVAPADVEQTVPLARAYQDVGTAFARSSWADDATYIAFVSRALGGHKYADICDRYGIGGTGHNHPAQNHFVLFGRGAVLAGDPGYTYEKKTGNHNTILVDGQGQYGDGQMWPRKTPGRAHITAFVTDGDVTVAAGDAVSAYPQELGLTRFDRTVVLAGRDLVVVCDRLAARQPRTFSWLLHHWGRIDKSGQSWTIIRDGAQLTVAPLLPGKLMGETSTYRPRFTHPHRDLTPEEPDVNMLELKTEPVTDSTFLVPLIVGAAGDAAAPPQIAAGVGCDAVKIGDTVVAFNRGGEMTVALPWGENLKTDARVVVARVLGGKRQLVTVPAAK